MDPNERFVVYAITRASIAADLNDYLDAMGLDNPKPLAPDDSRLASRVCGAYADALPLSTDDAEGLEAEAEAQVAALKAVGLLAADWAPAVAD